MIKPHAPIGFLLVLAACANAGSDEPAAAVSTDSAVAAVTDPGPEISRMLHASAEAWGRGDLEGFLDDYLDTPETTFVGASGVMRGTAEIRDRYEAGYWSGGRPEHRLRFEELEIRALGPDHALALGRYLLTVPGSDEVVSSGLFSLVLVRTEQGWKIIHDHSSASAPS